MTIIYRYNKARAPNSDAASFAARFVPYTVLTENFRSYIVRLGDNAAGKDPDVFVNKVTMLRHIMGTSEYEPWFTEDSKREVLLHFNVIDQALDGLGTDDTTAAQTLIYHRSLMERCIVDEKIRLSQYIKRNLQHAIDLDGRHLWTLLSDFSYLEHHYYKPRPLFTDTDHFEASLPAPKTGRSKDLKPRKRRRSQKQQIEDARVSA
jgi:hypothetical protein